MSVREWLELFLFALMISWKRIFGPDTLSTLYYSDFQKFEKKYKAELSKGSVSKDTQFEYAWCLIRSKHPEDIKKGIVLLDGNQILKLYSFIPLQTFSIRRNYKFKKSKFSWEIIFDVSALNSLFHKFPKRNLLVAEHLNFY